MLQKFNERSVKEQGRQMKNHYSQYNLENMVTGNFIVIFLRIAYLFLFNLSGVFETRLYKSY